MKDRATAITAIRTWMVAGLSGLALLAVAYGQPDAARQAAAPPVPAAPAAGAAQGPPPASSAPQPGVQLANPAGVVAAGLGDSVLGPNGEVWGFTDTAFNPGSRWRIHDADRPQPPVVTPGETVSIPPPSDAVVLFNGKDLSQWVSRGANGVTAGLTHVRDGYFEAQGGNLSTKASFGDVQLHLGYAIPAGCQRLEPESRQRRRHVHGPVQIQILDSYGNRTYADGMMASIYGEWPPLVNVSRKPGEWQSLDIIFEAPHFAGRVTARLTSPSSGTACSCTIAPSSSASTLPTMTPHVYTPHEAELPLQLQGRARVRYRNVWIRPLTPYNQGANVN